VRLLRFGMENFRCFREAVEVSFVATSQQDEPAHRMASAHAPNGVLPVLGVYGANAAGKTSVITALHVLRSFVERSFAWTPEQRIVWTPWAMRTGAGAAHTQLDLDFELGGVRYHYGFRFDARAFHEEWLYRWPDARRQVVFERNDAAEPAWRFGPSLRGDKARLAKATRSNALFLSTAAHNNHEELGAVYRAIVGGVHEALPIELNGFPVFFEDAPILDPARHEQFMRVLRALDLGCVDYEPVAMSLDPAMSLPQLAEVFQPDALEQVRSALTAQRKLYRIVLHREGPDGARWHLPSDMESSGTNVLLQRVNALMQLTEGVIAVDELETSLHPDVCAAIIDLFTSGRSNERGVQLLFTTHSRSLMEHLRRDEVLLVEKDADGVATLTCAADYKDLRARDSLERAYASGRVGAVPLLLDLDLALGA